MLRIDPSAAAQTAVVVASINQLLETRSRGIHVAGPRHEIAASLAFRITETSLRGITRFPEVMQESDADIVMAHIPHHTAQSRQIAKRLLTALIRNEINSGRMIAVEVTSRHRAVQRHVAEYWVMTPEQWRDLQRTRTALPPGTSYKRALTSK